MLTALVTRLAIAGAYLVTLLFPAPLDTIAAVIAVAVVIVWVTAALAARFRRAPSGLATPVDSPR